MKPSVPRSFSLFLNYNPFHNIIHYYVDLSTFLVTPGVDPLAPKLWRALNRRKRVTSLYSLEVHYGGPHVRDRFVGQCFKEVQEKNKTICGERLGFKDFFVPVLSEDKLLGYLQAGSFAQKEITQELIANCWKELSGREVSPDLTEFREFTRALLEIPVLDGMLFTAFQEVLELFAELLSGKGDEEKIGQRLLQLQVEVFSNCLLPSYWMDWALGRPTSESVPPWHRGMENWSWTRNEIRLTRIPTTVLAVIPRRSGFQNSDWLTETLRIYKFQRRSFHFARTLPETIGGKLDDYGSVFVTSANPKLPRLSQRRFIEEVARKIRDFAAKELGGPVLVGVGESLTPGEPLNPSYRQAVLALHLWKGSDKDILYFTESKKFPVKSGFTQLRAASDELNESFEKVSFSGFEALKERFLKQALEMSLQNPHEIRWHFQYGLDRLAETISARMDFGKKESQALRESMVGLLEKAATFQEIVLAYQEALSKLEREIENPNSNRRNQPVEKAKDHIDRYFGKPIRITRLARMSGISVSTFSRRFKKLTGLGLEAYIQKRRLEEAKRLLKTTRLPVFRIARDCGFKSNPHFIQLFRKKNGFPPQEFRKNLQNS